MDEILKIEMYLFYKLFSFSCCRIPFQTLLKFVRACLSEFWSVRYFQLLAPRSIKQRTPLRYHKTLFICYRITFVLFFLFFYLFVRLFVFSSELNIRQSYKIKRILSFCCVLSLFIQFIFNSDMTQSTGKGGVKYADSISARVGLR